MGRRPVGWHLYRHRQGARDSKFTKGSPNLKVSVDKVEESANPKGATVTANVVFQGQNAIKVRYVLTFRDGKIVDEIWQIDPKLAATAY
jgi:hypothetical protein